MIGSLRGIVLDRGANGQILLEVAGTGLGYRIMMDPRTSGGLDRGAEIFVWIHHHIREESQDLYGFLDQDEQLCFVALLGAHGVGPSLALAILSVHRPDQLAGVIASEDVDALCLVPGVGKKTAARLVIELKSRLDGIASASPDSVSTTLGSGGDLHDALVELGFRSDEIAQVLQRDEVRSSPDAGAALRLALKALGSGAHQ